MNAPASDTAITPPAGTPIVPAAVPPSADDESPTGEQYAISAAEAAALAGVPAAPPPPAADFEEPASAEIPVGDGVAAVSVQSGGALAMESPAAATPPSFAASDVDAWAAEPLPGRDVPSAAPANTTTPDDAIPAPAPEAFADAPAAAAKDDFVDVPQADGPFQLEQPWESASWMDHQTPTDGLELGDTATAFAPPEEAPAAEDASGLELAQPWEFVQWRRGDAPGVSAGNGPANPPPEARAPAPESAPAAGASATMVAAEAIRAMLDQADRDGAIAKALLRYCEGRFSRAFLFVERFDTAMVWRGIGDGTDDPGLAALRVDLMEPSALQKAADEKRPVHIAAPEGPQDEALYAALAPRSPYLVVAAVHARGKPVNFVYAESALEPLSPEAEAELMDVLASAGRAYERISAPKPA